MIGIQNYELFQLYQNEDCHLVILMIYHIFYMMAKFYGFTCTFLDQGYQSESWYV